MRGGGKNAWKTRQRVWTKEKLDWLIESKNRYDDREDILKAFNIHFNTNLTLRRLSFVNDHYKLKLPKSNRLLKKNIEEKRRLLFGREDIIVGEEITWNNGVFIKVSNTPKENHKNYILKKRYMYERYHNVKLNENDNIIFLNGNSDDYSKENLYKVTNNINGYMVGYNLYKKTSIDRLTKIKFCEWKEKINQLQGELK